MPDKENSRHTAALIGCGDIGYRFDRSNTGPGALSHLSALVKSGSFHVVGVADTDAGIRAEIATSLDIPVYAEYSEMLAHHCADLVVVATPDQTHARILAALPAFHPKLVFCEKPLAQNAREMESLIALYRSHGIGLTVNYTRRFIAEYADIRRRIISGDLGRVYSVVIYYSRGFVHNACHYIDLLLWWFGEPRDYQVEGARQGLTPSDQTLSVLLRYDSDLEVRLIGLESSDLLINEIDIIGTAGRIHVDTMDNLEVQRPQAHPSYKPFRCYAAQEEGCVNRAMALPRAYENLSATLDGAEEPLTPGHQSVVVQKIMEDILKRAI